MNGIITRRNYLWIPDIRSHGHSFPRSFVPTRFLTGPDIRAHIKWPPRTFVLTSNDHPGHSCSYQITTPDIRDNINFIYLFFTCLSPPTTVTLLTWSLALKINTSVGSCVSLLIIKHTNPFNCLNWCWEFNYCTNWCWEFN